MVKLLAKYRQWIMVFGGILLMVAFLLPQAPQIFGSDPTKREMFKIGTRSVTAQEREAAAAKLEIVQRAAPIFCQLHRIPLNSPEDFLLLCEEAKRGGFMGSAVDARDQTFVTQIAEEETYVKMSRIPAQYRSMLQQQMQSEEQKSIGDLMSLVNSDNYAPKGGVRYVEAMSDLRGITRMFEYYAGGTWLSEQRAVDELSKQFDVANVTYIEAKVSDAQVAATPMPDEAAIKAFYEKYKDVKAGTGPMGIGYTMPERVKIEYITVDKAAITKAVIPDAVEVLRRLPEPKADDKPGEREAKRKTIEAQVRNEQASKAIDEAEQTIKGLILSSTGGLPDQTYAGKPGFKQLPADWDQKKPDLNAIADKATARLRETLGTGVPALAVIKKMDWLTADDLRKIPGLGMAQLATSVPAAPLDTLVMSTREFSPKKVYAPLQLNVPLLDPLTDSAGNLYFIMVTAIRPAGGPTGLDEIRGQVVNDLKKVNAYDALVARKNDMVAMSVQLSPDDVATTLRQQGYTVSDAVTQVNLNRYRGAQPNNPEVTNELFVNTVMERAEQLDPKAKIGPENDAQRTLAVENPRAFAMTLVHIISYVPVTQEEFRDDVGSAGSGQSKYSQQGMADLFETKDWPFTHAKLVARLNVTGLNTKEKGGPGPMEE